MTLALAQAPRRLWNRYLSVLASNPARTKIATSITAAAVGDMIAQRMSHSDSNGKFRPDLTRTATLCVFNGGMGLFGHFYFAALDRGMKLGVSKTFAARSLLAVKKTFVDQVLCAPVATMMFYLLKVTAERRPSEYRRELDQKLVSTVLAGWQLWVPAHLVNFMFIPSQHRVLYTNIIAVGGTYVLSRASNAGSKTCQEEPKGPWLGRKKAGAAETKQEYEILSDCVVRVD
jgi:protein Mpv17